MTFHEIAFLEQLVAIPSPSGHETEVAAFLVNQMRLLGFDAHIDGAGNAIGTVGPANEGPLIALVGHIDTVPGAIPVRIEDGTLYGRGSVDAKGPFATFVCATARAFLAGALRGRVVLVGAVEEETASSRGAHFILNTYAPNYCVIGEPSGWDRVTLGYKGRLLIHYSREQPAAHSAGALRAAPEHLVDFWMAVQSRCAAHNHNRERLFEQISPSLRHIITTGDGLHDRVEATIGLRLPEGVEPLALAEELRTLNPNETNEDLPGTTTLRFEGACPAFRSERTTPLAGRFVRSIRAAGGKPGFLHKTGTSDMNVVGPAWQCPIVAYGPGDSRLDHTPDEHLSLDEYQKAIAVLTAVLSELPEGDPGLDR
jgi:LysW-gamma-L-lysine carboxypeptidase